MKRIESSISDACLVTTPVTIDDLINFDVVTNIFSNLNNKDFQSCACVKNSWNAVVIEIRYNLLLETLATSDVFPLILSNLDDKDIQSTVSVSKLWKEKTITFVKEKECILTEKFVENLILNLDCESHQAAVSQLKSIQEDLKKKPILNCISLSDIKWSKRNVEERILDILITLTDIDLLKLICFDNSLKIIKDDELIQLEEYTVGKLIIGKYPIEEFLENGELKDIGNLDNLKTRYLHEGFEYFFDLALNYKKLTRTIKEFHYKVVEHEIDICCLNLICAGYLNRCVTPILSARPEDRISICGRLAEGSPNAATTLAFLVFNDHEDRIKALNEILEWTGEFDEVLTAIKKAHLANDDHQCDFFIEVLKHSNKYKIYDSCLATSLEIVNFLQKHFEKKLMILTNT